MIKCLLIDESSAAIRILKRYIALMPALQLVGETGDTAEAIEMIYTQQPDIVFADYQPGVIVALQSLKSKGINIKFILCTARP